MQLWKRLTSKQVVEVVHRDEKNVYYCVHQTEAGNEPLRVSHNKIVAWKFDRLFYPIEGNDIGQERGA